MQALILAGGLGTRMRPLTDTLPKAMLPVNGKPFLEILLGKIRDQGITNFILATSYLHERIEEYFGSGKQFGVSITYCRNDQALGTGGHIKYAENLLEDSFLVFNGDSYSHFSYRDFYQFHASHDFDVSISLVFRDDASRFGRVDVKKTKVEKFLEKSSKQNPGYINSGVYVMSKRILKEFEKNKFISLEEEIFPKIVERGTMGGFVFEGYFIDIGTMESYNTFISDHKKGIV